MRNIPTLMFFAILILHAMKTPADSTPPTYPSKFLWGAAFSAHQTEGSLAGGGNNSDWYEFEHGQKLGKPNIKNGDNSDVAIDHWNRYEEDFRHAKALGLDTIRTSVAWEKIEPRPGEFNQEVLSHYKRAFIKMRLHGLKPMVCLQHFVHPKWFHEMGSWTHPDSPKWFLRYADRVVRELDGIVDLWITFNEPVLQAGIGYIIGKIPPFVRNPWKGFDAAFNLARAHRMVAHRIHEIQGVPAGARDSEGRLRGVGIAQSTQIFDPANPDRPADVKIANEIDELANWAFLRAVDTGRLQFKFPKGLAGWIVGDVDRMMPASDLPGSDSPSGSSEPMQDWIGLNYYSRYVVKRSFINPLGMTWLTPKGIVGDNGWAIYPEGLERLLLRAQEFKKPLVVTENGLADSSDSRRPAFIRDHLRAMDRALQAGVDLRGYYFWSLVDNFEWLEGYEKRFGLIEIKYDDNLKRVPRASAGVYRDEIRARRY